MYTSIADLHTWLQMAKDDCCDEVANAFSESEFTILLILLLCKKGQMQFAKKFFLKYHSVCIFIANCQRP